MLGGIPSCCVTQVAVPNHLLFGRSCLLMDLIGVCYVVVCQAAAKSFMDVLTRPQGLFIPDWCKFRHRLHSRGFCCTVPWVVMKLASSRRCLCATYSTTSHVLFDHVGKLSCLSECHMFDSIFEPNACSRKQLESCACGGYAGSGTTAGRSVC